MQGAARLPLAIKRARLIHRGGINRDHRVEFRIQRLDAGNGGSGVGFGHPHRLSAGYRRLHCQCARHQHRRLFPHLCPLLQMCNAQTLPAVA